MEVKSEKSKRGAWRDGQNDILIMFFVDKQSRLHDQHLMQTRITAKKG